MDVGIIPKKKKRTKNESYYISMYTYKKELYI